MASQTVRIQVWNLNEKRKQQWQPKRLKEGSPIEVAFAEEDIFWAWKRVKESDKYFWQFSPNPQGRQPLYITYNDDNDDVTLQLNESKSNFVVYAMHHFGYIVRVPKTNKYLAVKEGLLVLSHIPAVWFLNPRRGKIDADIVNMTEDNDQSMMWSSTATEGDEIMVVKTDQSDEDAQWYYDYIFSENSYQMQPKKNKDLYVTCDLVNESVILAPSYACPENSTLLKAKPVPEGYTDVGYIQNHAETRYFNTRDLGYETALSLTQSEKFAVAWRPKVYAFDINGMVFPPNPKCGCDNEEDVGNEK